MRRKVVSENQEVLAVGKPLESPPPQAQQVVGKPISQEESEKILPGTIENPIPAAIEDSAAARLAASIEEAGGEHYSRFESLIESVVVVVDPDSDYERLAKDLSIGGDVSQASYGELANALERAHTNMKDAFRLYVAAKALRDLVAHDLDVIEGNLRENAASRLEFEKETGARKKAITEGDIKMTIVAMYPDEAKRINRKRTRVENSVEMFKALAETWKKRCDGLQTLAAAARDVRSI